MKLIKYALVLVFITGISFSITGCSSGCEGEDPRARIINNGTSKASVQIKTSEGNTENINNVDPDMSSPYSSYAAGTITFTVTVDDMNYEKSFDLGTCIDYDISIDTNNNITATPIDRD